MAVYRQIHTSFWQDPFVLELNPDEKYFYLYLMTNTKTTQIGIYEIPKKIIQIETGFGEETVDELIKAFIVYNKIIYSENTNELMLINWIKYNGSSSPKILARVKTELREVKNKNLVKKYIDLSKEYGYDILSTLSTDDSLYIEYQYSIDTQSQREKEEEKEREKEREKEKEEGSSNSYPQNSVDKPKDENLSKIAIAFEKNGFGTINFTVKELLLELLDIYPFEWIEPAMKKAVEANKRSIGYVKGILKNWNANGGMQLEQPKTSPPVKKFDRRTKFHPKEQRSDNYTNEQLENIMERKRQEARERMKNQGGKDNE